MAGQSKPLPDRTFLWNTAVTTYAGAPVVISTVANTVTNPAGTAADIIVGIAQEDAGPLAPIQAVNAQSLAVQYFGTARCVAKGTINVGNAVKIGPTISITPAGYTSAITIYTVQAATQTVAGSQPYPIVGWAETPSAADGTYVFVRLDLNATY